MKFKNIYTYWTALIGDKSQYNIESRIFNAVSIFAIIGALVNITVNFSIGLEFYGFLLLPLVGFLLFGYYLSKNKRKLNVAVDMFAITFNGLCGATYFATGGSEGGYSADIDHLIPGSVDHLFRCKLTTPFRAN